MTHCLLLSLPMVARRETSSTPWLERIKEQSGSYADPKQSGVRRKCRAPWAHIGISIALLLLSGCGHVPEAKFEKTWVGRNSDDLIRTWGPPSKTASTSDGNTVLSYRRITIAPRTDIRLCDAIFFVGATHLILDARLRGDADTCRALVRIKNRVRPAPDSAE